MRFNALILLTLLAVLSACSRQDPPPVAASAAKDSVAHLVETAAVEEKSLSQESIRNGNLRARREVDVLPQEEGRIVSLPFFEGDHVERGQILLQLDDTLLGAELRKAEAQRRQAEQDLGRLERLIRNNLISEEELARARTALDVALADEQLLRARLAHTRIHAPFAGVISQRRAEPGDVMARFTHVLTLTDPTSLVTEVGVSELLLPSLAAGDAVSIHIDALGNELFAGRIQRIHPTVDPTTRQGTVEVALEPVPAGARPGQLCRVVLTGRPQTRRVVPFAALRRDNNGEFVYTVGADGKAQRSAVVSGIQLGDYVELINGPELGQAVVIKGFLGLAPGMRVSTAGAKAAPAPAAAR